jgi:GT2 family glycosyltransferase
MIHIVIPVLNRWHFTAPCLQALRQQTCQDFKTVIVDHGSTDGTRDLLVSNFPEVTVLHGDPSMWWTGATNMGVRHALAEGTDAVLTLNNDTVPSETYIEELVRATRIAGPKSLVGSAAVDAATGQTVSTGECVNWLLEKAVSPAMAGVDGAPATIVPCERYPGRGLLVPACVFRAIGLYDEAAFPHYLADYDFSQRASATGFPIYCAIRANLGTYPDETSANQLVTKKSFRRYLQHLFTRRGGAQLTSFYRYAFRHCPVYALPTFLVIGTVRRLGGYWLK